MNQENIKVLINIIGAVESGGQVYGNRRYNAYTPPYKNTGNEHTITLGWAQNYGYEAKKLIQLIYDKNPSAFEKIDSSGTIYRMLSKDWVSIKWKPTTSQKNILIELIDSPVGHEAQDELFAEVMQTFIQDCTNTYTKDVKAQMMYCEIRHLGGKKAADRVFKKCNNNFSLNNIMSALKQDQNDTSSSNQVGDKKFWSRHEKCYEFINKYVVSEEVKEEKQSKEEILKKIAIEQTLKKTEIQQAPNAKYDINKLINVAKQEIGYLEKKSNSKLDSKTDNAGSNNYTKYWRDMKPSYQGQAWCDCFVDWCFVQAYGKEAAQELECGGCGEYYTPTSAQYYKNKKQWYSSPKVGDQIFFRNSERICHTGIVINVKNSMVTTIEGNTSGASGVIANGGGVCQKEYSTSNSRIAGYGRPNYSGASAPAPEETIGKNITEVSTKEIQHMLNLLGWNLKEDGIYGKLTTEAVKIFQRHNSLTADGIVGKYTLAKLQALTKLQEKNPSKAPVKELLINTTGFYNNTVKQQGEILSTVNCRRGAGTKYAPLISYPRLEKGTKIGVCDLIRGSEGGLWYFVKITNGNDSKYGFVNVNYVKLL